MKSTKDIIEILESHGITDDSAMVDALEDGEALAYLGITDADTDSVEGAHALLTFREMMADVTRPDEQTILRSMPWTG